VRSYIEIYPKSNFALASPVERTDEMLQLARVFMGLQFPVQLISQAREVDGSRWSWPDPPKIERRWQAVVLADEPTECEWRISTLKTMFERIGLRCSESQIVENEPVIALPSPHAVMDGDGYWTTSLVLRRWPREVAPGWLGQALSFNLPVDVALHIEPKDPQKVARFLRKQQTWQSNANSVKPDAANELGREDAESVRRKLVAGIDRPCKIAVVLTVRASTRETLNNRVKAVLQQCGLVLADVRKATCEHDRGLIATSLTGMCQLLGVWRTLDCTSVASTWLFQPATVNHPHGADIGTSNGQLVRLDPFDETLKAFGGVVLAMSGAGKSYLLKLIARRLPDVEMLVVEQNDPPEYASVPGIKTLNLADVNDDAQEGVLAQYIEDLWEESKRDPRPRLLILDELWSLLQKPALAKVVERVARRGRHHWLALWIATQQVQEMMSNDHGLAVINNAAIRVYLSQHGPDLEKLAEVARLTDPQRRYLRGAARGQALLDVGRMVIPVDIQATPEENAAITTDPRERRRVA
jgi:hypothetical protein